MEGKLVIVTAPSGAGKTSIAKHLLSAFPDLAFSVSATTRKKRPEEQEGVDYFFISDDDFRMKVMGEEFIEWEEVYQGIFYGTLKKEVERVWAEGKAVLFDVDVKGALNLKNKFPETSLAIFIKPPSLQTLIDRLQRRATESPEKIAERIRRAEQELMFEPFFETCIVNDDLSQACLDAEEIVRTFLKGNKSPANK